MPTLNINGRQVTVGDEFLSLTPEQQDATVDEIAQSMGIAQPPAAANPRVSEFANSPAGQAPAPNQPGTGRALKVGMQTVGRGLANVAGAPVDLMTGALNVASRGVNAATDFFGVPTDIPQITTPYGGSEMLKQTAFDAAKQAGSGPPPLIETPASLIGRLYGALAGEPIDEATFTAKERLAGNINDFGTQALTGGGALATRALAKPVARMAEPVVSKLSDIFTRAYSNAPARTVAGDTAAGMGAGAATDVVQKNVDPESPWRPAADAAAVFVGGSAGALVPSVAEGVGAAFRSGVRNRMVDTGAQRAGLPLKPDGTGYTKAELDAAARDFQGTTYGAPKVVARDIRENADELRSPTLPGEKPVEPSQMPTSGLLSRDPGLVTQEYLAERTQRQSAPAFIERDQNVKSAAAERVASLRDVERPGEPLWDLSYAYSNFPVYKEWSPGQPLPELSSVPQNPNRVKLTPRDPGVPAYEVQLRDQGDGAQGIQYIERVGRQGRDRSGYGADAYTALARGLHDSLGQKLQIGADVGNSARAAVDNLSPSASRVHQKLGQAGYLQTEGDRTFVRSDVPVRGPRKAFSPADTETVQSVIKARPEELAAQRDAAALPLLKQAEQNPNPVNVEPVVGAIDEKLSTAKREPVRGALTKAKAMLNKPGSEEIDTSVAGLYETRKAINDIIEGRTENSTGRFAQKELIQVRDALDKQLGEVSPEFPQYLEKFREGSKPLNAFEQSTTLRKATEADDIRDVARGLLESNDYGTAKRMDEIVEVVNRDPKAKAAWKAAVSEVLVDRVSGTRKAGENAEVQYARLAQEFKNNEQLLAKVYTPEEMNTLRQAHKLLEYFKEAEKRATIGSNTADKVHAIPMWFQLGIRHLKGDLVGGGIVKRMKLFMDLLPSDKQSISEIRNIAWFNPDVAAYLLERPIKNYDAAPYNINLKRLMAAAAASRDD